MIRRPFSRLSTLACLVGFLAVAVSSSHAFDWTFGFGGPAEPAVPTHPAPDATDTTDPLDSVPEEFREHVRASRAAAAEIEHRIARQQAAADERAAAVAAREAEDAVRVMLAAAAQHAAALAEETARDAEIAAQVALRQAEAEARARAQREADAAARAARAAEASSPYAFSLARARTVIATRVAHMRRVERYERLEDEARAAGEEPAEDAALRARLWRQVMEPTAAEADDIAAGRGVRYILTPEEEEEARNTAKRCAVLIEDGDAAGAEALIQALIPERFRLDGSGDDASRAEAAALQKQMNEVANAAQAAVGSGEDSEEERALQRQRQALEHQVEAMRNRLRLVRAASPSLESEEMTARAQEYLSEALMRLDALRQETDTMAQRRAEGFYVKKDEL